MRLLTTCFFQFTPQLLKLPFTSRYSLGVLLHGFEHCAELLIRGNFIHCALGFFHRLLSGRNGLLRFLQLLLDLLQTRFDFSWITAREQRL